MKSVVQGPQAPILEKMDMWEGAYGLSSLIGELSQEHPCEAHWVGLGLTIVTCHINSRKQPPQASLVGASNMAMALGDSPPASSLCLP